MRLTGADSRDVDLAWSGPGSPVETAAGINVAPEVAPGGEAGARVEERVVDGHVAEVEAGALLAGVAAVDAGRVAAVETTVGAPVAIRGVTAVGTKLATAPVRTATAAKAVVGLGPGRESYLYGMRCGTVEWSCNCCRLEIFCSYVSCIVPTFRILS